MSDHSIDLIRIYRRNLNLLLRQRATFGDSLVPQHIEHGIQEARRNIAEQKRLLIEFYNITVEDAPGIDYDVEEVVTVQLSRADYDRLKIIAEAYDIII